MRIEISYQSGAVLWKKTVTNRNCSGWQSSSVDTNFGSEECLQSWVASFVDYSMWMNVLNSKLIDSSYLLTGRFVMCLVWVFLNLWWAVERFILAPSKKAAQGTCLVYSGWNSDIPLAIVNKHISATAIYLSVSAYLKTSVFVRATIRSKFSFPPSSPVLIFRTVGVKYKLGTYYFLMVENALVLNR